MPKRRRTGKRKPAPPDLTSLDATYADAVNAVLLAASPTTSAQGWAELDRIHVIWEDLGIDIDKPPA
jgi:hypothetical protein